MKTKKICLILAFVTMLAGRAGAEVLLIDDFNRCQKPNLISGDYGIWSKTDWDRSMYCSDSLTSNPDIVYGRKGCSLQLDYDVESRQPAYTGMWMRLEKIDLNKYKYLVFYVRGDYYKCFTSRFKIELKNMVKFIEGTRSTRCPCKGPQEKGRIRESDIAIYEVEGVDAQWRQVIVPLESALKDADFSEAFEFTVVFDEQFVTQKKGRIYIDNIYFTDGEVLPSCCGEPVQVKEVYLYNAPPRVVFSAPSAVCVDEEFVLDASGTTDDNAECLSYAWDFGDGTKGEGITVKKAYKKKGTYKVVLEVDDYQCTECSKSSFTKLIKVNTPPIAEAGKDVNLCIDARGDYEVVFDGSKSYDPDGDALTYKWDFGDGERGTGEKVTHVYKRGGSYKVRLTVDDGAGTSCSKAEDTVNVCLNKPPVADAGPNLVCCAGQENVFDASGSYDPEGDFLSYHWDFGDGTKAEGVRVKHTYTKLGTYNVTLTVRDNSGTKCDSAVDSFMVNVSQEPVPVIKVK
ncbi:MAG: PKD domain-containing protein [Candidatus Omnitrophica bacterium]|nr:PKD domain-containing protein [Candidatus Omnitrophota bacterium]